MATLPGKLGRLSLEAWCAAALLFIAQGVGADLDGAQGGLLGAGGVAAWALGSGGFQMRLRRFATSFPPCFSLRSPITFNQKVCFEHRVSLLADRRDPFS